MEKWKAKYAFHFPTPSTATRYLQKSMRYTNNPTGTKDRALQKAHCYCFGKVYDYELTQQDESIFRWIRASATYSTLVKSTRRVSGNAVYSCFWGFLCETNTLSILAPLHWLSTFCKGNGGF